MGVPLFHRLRYTSDQADILDGPGVLKAIQISANGGNVDCELNDALTDTGVDTLTYHVLDGETKKWSYVDLGGVAFETGLTLDVTSNAVVNLWVG